MPQGFSVQSEYSHHLIFAAVASDEIPITKSTYSGGGIIFQHHHYGIIICVRRAIRKIEKRIICRGVGSRAGMVMIRIGRGRYIR